MKAIMNADLKIWKQITLSDKSCLFRKKISRQNTFCQRAFSPRVDAVDARIDCDTVEPFSMLASRRREEHVDVHVVQA